MKSNSSASTMRLVAGVLILLVLVGLGLIYRSEKDSTQILNPAEPGGTGSAEVSDPPLLGPPDVSDDAQAAATAEQTGVHRLMEQVARSASTATPKPMVASPTGVSLTGKQVLAVVNGTQINAGDLIGALNTSGTAEVTISPEQFEFLLNRAIERELVFQAAEKEGVGLLEEDEVQLAQLRDSRAHDASVVDPIGDQEAILDADQLQGEAQLLEKRLLQKQGVPLPYVSDERVLAYYEANIDKYGQLPDDPVQGDAAWQQIDLEIRRELTQTARTEYQAQRDQYILQLRANAQVEVLVASSN